MRRAAGFTLIEMVLVMLVISVGLLGLTGLFSNTVKSLSTNEILQQAGQYAQECAEQVITARRDPTKKFTWFDTNTFSCGNPSNFTRTVAVSPLISATPNYYTGNNGTCNGHTPCPCPNGINCRDVTITATSTANTALSSVVTLLLVDY